MKIPTEPIGSIPRPGYLIDGMKALSLGTISQSEFLKLTDQAIKDTVQLFEKTGSPVITDGEQAKPSFATYPLHGMKQLAPDGVVIPFADGHTRQLPRLTEGPFRFQTYANSYLAKPKSLTKLPVKQAVISASALALIYPQSGIPGYSHETFIGDLVKESVSDIRKCLDNGAYNVQIDFTEARLAIKLDPSKQLLKSFIELNNKVIDHFSAAERKKIGVHTCPGGDHDSTHSADIDYSELLPLLFELRAGNFYLEYAGEKDKVSTLKAIKKHAKADQKVFIGVIDVLKPRVESPDEVCELIVEAASYIPVAQLGTTDDCGFSPFADDTSTSRDTAFAKIDARIKGTALAEKKLSK